LRYEQQLNTLWIPIIRRRYKKQRKAIAIFKVNDEAIPGLHGTFTGTALEMPLITNTEWKL
jgi:hypothetical protein